MGVLQSRETRTDDRANGQPQVSFVVPARNEAHYLPETLSSIATLHTDRPYEVIVVDGGSADETPEIASESGAAVVEGPGTSIAAGRNLGAEHARGEWLAFVDADTVVRPTYLDEALRYAERNDLAAASSRCRITGPRRAKAMEATINYVFPRLSRPILPGFNFLIRTETFDAHGGFPDVANEDTAFSRHLARTERTGYCPAVLVESSGRRIAERGLTGTLVHYARLDYSRIRSTIG